MSTKIEQIELIKKLSNANGVSGFEDEVVAICHEEIADVCDAYEDTLRNLYFTAKNNNGERPKVWLDAHTDEVGFIVQYLKDNGTLGFLSVGGWVPSTIPASKVRVKTTNGNYISGVVTSKPPHFMSAAEQGKGLKIDQMSIDVGAVSKDELRDSFGVGVAAPVVPDVICEYDEQHEMFLGKAFDCRIGVAALIETIKQVASDDLAVDIVGTFTAQEEVGLRGAKVATEMLSADVAIVFEGGPADDGIVPSDQVQNAIKKGPMLRHFDVSMINNPRFMRHTLNVAKETGIPVQEAVRSGGGTNGGAIHMSKNGIPTIVITVPVRYIHSHHGFVAYHDYNEAVNLAKAVIKSLNADVISTF